MSNPIPVSQFSVVELHNMMEWSFNLDTISSINPDLFKCIAINRIRPNVLLAIQVIPDIFRFDDLAEFCWYELLSDINKTLRVLKHESIKNRYFDGIVLYALRLYNRKYSTELSLKEFYSATVKEDPPLHYLSLIVQELPATIRKEFSSWLSDRSREFVITRNQEPGVTSTEEYVVESI